MGNYESFSSHFETNNLIRSVLVEDFAPDMNCVVAVTSLSSHSWELRKHFRTETAGSAYWPLFGAVYDLTVGDVLTNSQLLATNSIIISEPVDGDMLYLPAGTNIGVELEFQLGSTVYSVPAGVHAAVVFDCSNLQPDANGNCRIDAFMRYGGGGTIDMPKIYLRQWHMHPSVSIDLPQSDDRWEMPMGSTNTITISAAAPPDAPVQGWSGTLQLISRYNRFRFSANSVTLSAASPAAQVQIRPLRTGADTLIFRRSSAGTTAAGGGAAPASSGGDDTTQAAVCFKLHLAHDGYDDIHGVHCGHHTHENVFPEWVKWPYDLGGTVTTNFDATGNGGEFVWTLEGVASTCRFDNVGSVTTVQTGPYIYGNVEGGTTHTDTLYVAYSTNDTVVNLDFDYPSGRGACGRYHNSWPSYINWSKAGSGTLAQQYFPAGITTNSLLIPAGTQPGLTYIYAHTRDSITGEWFSRRLDVNIINVDLDYDIWWFADETPGGSYHTRTWLTAEGVSEGTFKWDVTDGADRVDLSDGVTDSDSITVIDNNRIRVKSTRGSSSELDTAITLTYNGVQVCEFRFTVGAPWSIDVVSGPIDSTHFGTGYKTEYLMRVLDKFNVVLPHDLPVNEDFGTWVSDWTIANGRPHNENWPDPSPNSTMTGISPNPPVHFKDTYAYASVFSNPITVPPSNSHAGEKVKHSTQYYHAGSLVIGNGMLIKTHTLQHYRGKGRQE